MAVLSLVGHNVRHNVGRVRHDEGKRMKHWKVKLGAALAVLAMSGAAAPQAMAYQHVANTMTQCANASYPWAASLINPFALYYSGPVDSVRYGDRDVLVRLLWGSQPNGPVLWVDCRYIGDDDASTGGVKNISFRFEYGPLTGAPRPIPIPPCEYTFVTTDGC